MIETTHMANQGRREFIQKAALAATGLLAGVGPARGVAAASNPAQQTPAPKKASPLPVCIFSKQLHWLGYEEMAQTVAQLGFDGIDLTVRPGGHVLPENVATDLPKAVAVARKAGLDVPMLTTSITDARHPHTELILKTASQLGINYYRTGWLPYPEEIPIPETLEKYKLQLRELAALNKRYGIHGAYQNHAGTDMGAAVWDLWYLIRELEPEWIGLQYDIKHATLEGGQSWPNDVRLMHSYIKTMDIKDFKWTKNDGKWQVQMVPLGEGMVDFRKFFGLVKQYQISGPISLHMEYPLGGAENGATKLSVNRDIVLEAMRKDLENTRRYMKEAGL
jgi:sugar phosphate isomerase/epimerase